MLLQKKSLGSIVFQHEWRFKFITIRLICVCDKCANQRSKLLARVQCWSRLTSFNLKCYMQCVLLIDLIVMVLRLGASVSFADLVFCLFHCLTSS